MSHVRKTILIFASALIFAALLILAYLIGRNRGSETTGVNIVENIDELVTNEQEAIIVKRVSQQMEAIAYQQKTISEMQRDRAEEQSRIAISMRDKAEKESQAARSAENKALQLAHQAELSAKEAAKQRDQATLAKRISDTLTYRTLGRTLAGSAIYDYEDGQFDIAGIMAYASWYFLDRYKGNVYLPECFQALYQSAKADIHTYMHGRGAVKSMTLLEDGSCILVSDYGEIEYQAVPGTEGKVLFHDLEYDFRAVCSNGNNAYAISAHGPVCFIEKDRLVRSIALPGGNYYGIEYAGNNLLFIWGSSNVLWLNTKSGRFVSITNDPGRISAALYYGGNMHAYFTDGTSAVLDSKGDFKYETPLFDEPVTAAYYDSLTNCVYFGGKSGHVLRKNLSDGSSSVLYGHTSGILFINVINDVAVTGSYDKNVYIWNLSLLRDVEGKNQENNSNQSGSVSNDWLIPAAITANAWPYSAIRLNDAEILVGYSNGSVGRYTVSVSSLASKVMTGIKRNLTPAEWQQYIGANVPYVKFK